jgi:hypothetical protein
VREKLDPKDFVTTGGGEGTVIWKCVICNWEGSYWFTSMWGKGPDNNHINDGCPECGGTIERMRNVDNPDNEI